MDPFNEDSENETGGKLYINLGNVSEDVLNDSQLEFENGLPSANNTELETDTSSWGIYPDPTTFNVVNAFDNSTNDYSLQDVGLDGLNSENEREFSRLGWMDLTATYPRGLGAIPSGPVGG